MNNKTFIQYLRILNRSGHKKFILEDYRAWAYYDVDVDDDTGYHYSIEIVDRAKFDIDFFTKGVVFDVSTILSEYATYNKMIKQVYGTKGITEDIVYDDDLCKLIISSYFEGELKFTLDISLENHVDNAEVFVDKFVDTMLRWEENKSDIPSCEYNIDMPFVEAVMERNDVVSVPFKVDGKKIKMPFTKSSWLQLKKFNSHTIELRKSNIGGIYQFIHTMDAKGFIQSRFGYVVKY